MVAEETGVYLGTIPQMVVQVVLQACLTRYLST